MRHFCTAGPVQDDIHYVLPPLARLNRDDLMDLIEQRKYFLLHAPRQTGKTSCLLALTHDLNAGGKFRAVYANLEQAQTAREDVAAAMPAILNALTRGAISFLNDEFPASVAQAALRDGGPHSALAQVLTQWARHDPMPLCVFLDEVDALVGDTLISVLRQLRGGYADRPQGFPQSLILCGVRDLADYRIHGTREIITGGSAFNIKAKSLRLGDFTPDDIAALYGQHTAETGQTFAPEVFPLVWELTRGQPWLVNALAQNACFDQREHRDRSRQIDAGAVVQAKESLIAGRETHIDQLAYKLREDRVRRVMEPILAGADRATEAQADDDTQYCIDLGLIRRGPGGLEIANRIYQEVIPRELAFEVQTDLMGWHRTEWYVTAGGRLDMDKLIEAFQQFYRENSEIWLRRFLYQEAGPQLLMQAFFQRIVNGGGRIEREYGLGRRRTDLFIPWNHAGGVQRVVIELKMLRASLERTIAGGLAQTIEYMDRTGTGDAHLVIFDPRPEIGWDAKIFRREESYRDRRITVWGM